MPLEIICADEGTLLFYLECLLKTFDISIFSQLLFYLSISVRSLYVKERHWSAQNRWSIKWTRTWRQVKGT